MTVVRVSPYSAFNFLNHVQTPNRLNDFVNHFFDDQESDGTTEISFEPAIDIFEEQNGYTVEVILPGVKKDDVSIQVKDNTVSISGERKKNENEGLTYHLIESKYGKFSKELELSDDIDKESIEASFTDGVLSLYFNKKKEEVSKHIEIK